MRCSRKGSWSSLAAVACAVHVACEPAAWTREDTFPDRLARGRSTLEHCKVLVAEAAGRFRDCRQYWIGTSVEFRRQRLERCTYEMRDYDRAVALQRRLEPQGFDPALLAGKLILPAVPIADEARYPEPETGTLTAPRESAVPAPPTYDPGVSPSGR